MTAKRGRKRDDVKCSRCGKGMTERIRKRDGAPFLGCQGYPACKGTASYVELAVDIDEDGCADIGCWECDRKGLDNCVLLANF